MSLADSECGSVAVESTWKELRGTKDKECQTEPTAKTESVGTQSAETTSISVQTEEVAVVGLSDKADPALGPFLQKVSAMMEEQLLLNAESHAFDDYTVAWDEDRDIVAKLHAIRHDWVPPASSKDGAITGEVSSSCSACTWNCNGTVIGVAYGSLGHQGWCNHRGGICFWNVMQRHVGAGNTADIVIETPCCVTCCEFHPQEPSLVVGGLFNGEIRVWDTSNADNGIEPLIMSSTVDDYFHREPIAQVSWVKDMRSRAFQIISINGDGKVLFWTMENKLLYPISGFALIPSSASRNRHPIMGGVSVAVSHLDYSNFVIGTEAGGIFRAVQNKVAAKKGKKPGDSMWSAEAFDMIESTDPANALEVKKVIEDYARAENLKAIGIPEIFKARPDPLKLFPNASRFAFEPHAGPVYSLAASPFHRKLFLSCSTDCTARIFNILRPKALLYLEPGPHSLMDVAWSPARPLVFAVGDAMGKVYVYDLLENMITPVLVIPVCEGKAITAISFNGADSSLLASVDETGQVHIWQLSPRLSEVQSGEIKIINNMGASGN